MILFNSSRFLCCSVAFFGVSTTSPKNPSLFSISPTIVIIFIKCRNRQHMKNNIRYKGNTNHTSIIIFLKVKNSQRCYFAWQNLRWGFCDLHFCCCIFICPCSSFCCCCSFTFFFDVIPHPFVDYRRGFYTPFYTSSPGHRRVICDTFIFDHFVFAASGTVLSGHFLPQCVFYVTLPHQHLNLGLSRLPWEPAVLPWSLQGFIPILETQTRPICLFDSQ